MTIRRFDIEPLLPILQDGFTLLTPNNRSVDGILREYASEQRAQGEISHAWQRPAVFAIDIYIQHIWQLAASQAIAPFDTTRILGRFDEQEIWLKLIHASYEKYPLLNIEDTARAAARSYRSYKQWDVGANNKIEHYRNAIDFQTFLSWSEQFESRCKKLHAVSLSDASQAITTHVEKLAAILPRKIALINFDQPPPLYERLFQALGLVCEVVWHRTSEQKESLATTFASSLAEGNCTHRSYQNSSDEIDACLAWCHNKALEFPQAHIGIVVDPGRSLEPLIEETLFRDNTVESKNKFNIAEHLNHYHSSETLDELPDFSAALSILTLNYELIDSERFCKLLQSANILGAENEMQARIALEIQLRRNTEAETRLSELRRIMTQRKYDHYCPILAEALLAFSELARHEPSHQSLRKWLLLFNKQLEALGWPGSNLAEHNRRQLQQWQQCLQHIAASSTVLGKISLSAALGKLQNFLKQSNVNLNFDDRLQISLLDIEEAKDLLFDYVWILSVDDRSWPQAANPVSFLPYGLQQHLQMPNCSSQQQLELAISQLCKLRNNTKAQLVFSHHTLEEELSIRPSALLREIQFDPSDKQNTAIQESHRIQSNTPLETLEEKLHIPLNPGEQVNGGTSLLSNQSNCPFRAFARNRLSANELEEFSHGLNSIVRGNALHKALEYLGEHLGDSQTLHALSFSETEDLLDRSSTVAIEYLRRRHPETMTPAFSILEKGRMSGLLSGFLDLEKLRSNFSIEHNEKNLTWQYSRLSLNLRIDRIDRLDDGSLALIDYKTGKFTNYRWFDDRPDDLQLPLYQIAVTGEGEDSVSATLILQINAENIGFVSPMENGQLGAPLKVSSQGKTFEGGWPSLQNYWNNRIIALVEEFESGLTAIAPTRGYMTCQYCELGPLCRINESNQSLSIVSEEDL
jgi:ATP-dependent helicase/nuclease subunit B